MRLGVGCGHGKGVTRVYSPAAAASHFDVSWFSPSPGPIPYPACVRATRPPSGLLHPCLVCRPATLGFPGSLLEMQSLRPHALHFDKNPGHCICIVKFENNRRIFFFPSGSNSVLSGPGFWCCRVRLWREGLCPGTRTHDVRSGGRGTEHTPLAAGGGGGCVRKGVIDIRKGLYKTALYKTALT